TTRPSRIARDNKDAAKLSQWLSEHNPFPKIDVIMSIDSGIVGGNEATLSKGTNANYDDKVRYILFMTTHRRTCWGQKLQLSQVNVSIFVCFLVSIMFTGIHQDGNRIYLVLQLARIFLGSSSYHVSSNLVT
ncbi:hypothetical protein AVEN_124532-1, partial [Araneus ventricosus]